MAGSGVKFWSRGNIVSLGSIPLSGWSGVQIPVGTNICLFSKMPRQALLSQAFVLRGTKFKRPGHEGPSNVDVTVELYHFSRSMLSCHGYRDSLRAGDSGYFNPIGDTRFSAPVKTGPGAHPAFHLRSTHVPSWDYSGRSVKLTMF